MRELKQLRVLSAVAETGSFCAAAIELDYTQPAVSQIVASLEGEMGTALVNRDTNPIRLTDAGAALARHAKEMLERLRTAEAEVRATVQPDG